jgi:hypothetical protein
MGGVSKPSIDNPEFQTYVVYTIVCPDYLAEVCETSYRIQEYFVESHSLHYLFINLFLSEVHHLNLFS